MSDTPKTDDEADAERYRHLKTMFHEWRATPQSKPVFHWHGQLSQANDFDESVDMAILREAEKARPKQTKPG